MNILKLINRYYFDEEDFSEIEYYETYIFRGKHIFAKISPKYYKPLIYFLKEKLDDEEEMRNVGVKSAADYKERGEKAIAFLKDLDKVEEIKHKTTKRRKKKIEKICKRLDEYIAEKYSPESLEKQAILDEEEKERHREGTKYICAVNAYNRLVKAEHEKGNDEIIDFNEFYENYEYKENEQY